MRQSGSIKEDMKHWSKNNQIETGGENERMVEQSFD
jgi:hypothetical protein